MTAGAVPPPEFSRVVDIAALGEGKLTRDIEASAAERVALSKRFGLNALSRLSASLTLRRRGGRIVELLGHIDAELEQVCVVSLEPVPVRISKDFRQIYSPDLPTEAAGEVVVSADEEEDEPEPLVGGRIDLGEAVAQQLAVSLDPYPRRPDARIPEAYRHEEKRPSGNGAFAPVARLRGS